MNHQPPKQPACPQAEAALLGAVLLAPHHAAALLAGITEEHMTHPRHEAVLQAIQALQAGGRLPEPVAVLERLQRAARTRSAGLWADRAVPVVLDDLMAAVTVPAAAPYWRDLVLQYAFRRMVIAAAVRLDQAAREAGAEHLDAVVEATRRQLATTSTPAREHDDVVGIGSREAA